MPGPHRHHEIEFNFIYSGSITYLFGGSSLEVQAGQALLFWGALPHVLTDIGEDAMCGWLYLPLATLLRFGLVRLHSQLLQGVPILTDVSDLDLRVFERWLVINAEDPTRQAPEYPMEPPPEILEKQRIIELEAEAFLRRLSAVLPRSTAQVQPAKTKAAELAQYVSENYLQAMSIADIAGAADITETYASNLFRKTFSLTLIEYLTQHRVAHAQRLLATTSLSVLEIAFASGFGSASQFYTCFKRLCSRSPTAYRKSLLHAETTLA